MSMQQIILGKIKSMFDEMADSTYSWVDKPDWSNTGSVYFFDDSLNTLGSFTYNFQDSYFTLTFFEANAKPIHAIGCSPTGAITNVHGQYHALPIAIEKVRDGMVKIFCKTPTETYASHPH